MNQRESVWDRDGNMLMIKMTESLHAYTHIHTHLSSKRVLNGIASVADREGIREGEVALSTTTVMVCDNDASVYDPIRVS